MKQVICKDLADAVVLYHECLRDTDVKPIKFVTSPRGATLLLVRYINEAGVKMSGLDSYDWDYTYQRWDIKDPMYSERKMEKMMVEDYMTYCGDPNE